ncbi:MAG: S9 family peptidase [Acidimicrobiia bacterium]
MTEHQWVGVDEHFGLPSLDRPDAAKASSFSLEAIAALERPHDAALSPDGSKVATMLDRDTSDVWVVDVDGTRQSRITTGRELAAYWEDDAPAWSPDGVRLAYSDNGSVWVTPVAGGLPTKLVKGSSPVWVGKDELFVTVERDEKSRLARIAIPDPWPQPVTPPEQNISGTWVSADRSVALYVNHPPEDRQSSEIWLVEVATGVLRQLTRAEGAQDRGARLASDGNTVGYVSERSGWFEIHTIARDGTNEQQLTRDAADFSALSWAPGSDRLLARRTRRGSSDLVVVEVPTGVVTVLASGGDWTPVGWSEKGAVAIHEAHDTPPRMVVVGEGAEMRPILEGVPASIRRAHHRPYEEVTYTSIDGMEIHGFLFKPDRARDERVPAVVYPHGGPTSAYEDSWDGHAQYFVDKGYSWFAINFRGSTGYGREFERSNHGVWGVKDTEDCLAAADYLASLDWIDGERLAIFGASYGSYLALSSLATDPEHRYACGVAKYGDSDITSSWAQSDRTGREDLERMMGTPSQSRATYRAGSPLASVGNIERPILIAHGEKDARVPPDQSSQLVTELRRLGKTFEYITYPTEGHGLLRAGPQIHFYRRLERFLDWHLM